MADFRFRSRLLHTTAILLNKPPLPPSTIKSTPSQSSITKIGIVIKSFEHQSVDKSGLPPYTNKVALPTTRSLYTVLRSPHVDKKSREQFEMRIYKQYLEIKTDRKDLCKKLFWLKRHRQLGGQLELRVQSQTRLDPKEMEKYLKQEVSGAIEENNLMIEAGEEVADGAKGL